MTEQTLETIRQRVSEALRRPAIPGVVVAVAREREPIEHLVVGTDARGQPLMVDTLFPAASITKLATALSVLRLVDRGALHYEDRLDAYLPDAAAARAGVTLRMLFTHTAGLQGMENYDTPLPPEAAWAALTEVALHAAPEVAPGTRLSYSDIDYVLLAMVVERIPGQAFPAACRQLVLDPLGMEAYFAPQPPRAPARIGAEPDPHTGTPFEWHNSAYFRPLCLPTSGLVTTAAGVLTLIRAYAGVPEDFLRPETRAAASRDQSGGVAAGFDSVHEPPQFPSYPWGLGPEIYDPARAVF